MRSTITQDSGDRTVWNLQAKNRTRPQILKPIFQKLRFVVRTLVRIYRRTKVLTTNQS
ncbi:MULTISPECIES: hypothetical protein [unclassified Microcoleus]|uniref:hypothetical protein n=1 Tax=unclassified Microcoleus TaxID=2642155 RepID=UPI002FD3D7A7